MRREHLMIGDQWTEPEVEGHVTFSCFPDVIQKVFILTFDPLWCGRKKKRGLDIQIFFFFMTGFSK